MSSPTPSFFARIGLAFRVLFSGALAARLTAPEAPQLPPPEPEPEPEPPPPVVQRAPSDAALQLLGLLQREGRFIDFLEEDVSEFSDEDIGAAARVVHEGCRKAVREHFDLTPVMDQEEDAKVEVPEGFDPAAIRLTGQVVGEAPFQGVLQHRGWRVADAHLPKLAKDHDVSVLAPAEVEIG